MKAKGTYVSCPKCGENGFLVTGEIKRNRHLKLTCSKCGCIHSAVDALKMATYQRLKELGYPTGEAPGPEPADPVQVFRGQDGSEVVIRNTKNPSVTIKRPSSGKRPTRP